VVVGHKLAQPTATGLPYAQANDLVRLTYVIQGEDRTERPRTESRSLLVSGVADRFGVTFLFDVDTSIIASPRTVQNLFDVRGYNNVVVLAESTEDVGPVRDLLDEAYGEDAFVIAVQQIADVVAGVLGGLTALVAFIAGISLVVAGVGIANTMLVSVMERTREIGVMRAIGFRAKDVRRIFLLEAAITGVLGGLIGIVAGAGISYAIAWALNQGEGGGFEDPAGSQFSGPGGTQPSTGLAIELEPVLSPELLLGVLLFAVLVAALAGFLPARKAAKLDPVQALSDL
ncbi:MAG: FtsX-like permease family protein, partial [Candidatus Thermoplasmatota archaeon]|nr:FtsX-like permease family protein [Candidatus Thermoplasmatota archaeon]